MVRLHLSPEEITRPLTSLPADKASYLVRVLRLGPGDPVQVFDGSGRVYDAVVEQVSGGLATLRIPEGRVDETPDPVRHLHLVQAIPKGEVMDRLVRRVTEIGVHALHPVVTARTVVRPGSGRAPRRVERWRRIAAAAARQCGRNVNMEIGEIRPLARALELLDCPGPRMVCHGGKADPGLSGWLDSLSAGPAGSAALAIGPEGGWTEEELELMGDQGFSRVALGPRSLRVETAATAAAVLVMAWMGELG